MSFSKILNIDDSKFLSGISALWYLTLLILSIFFYKERAIFIDLAYHLFCILKDGDFAIQNFRFGAAITQLFPLLGLKLNMSLGQIAAFYSAGFMLLYIATFLIIFKWIKQERFAMAYLLFGVLMTTHTFYWIQSELPQGAAFLFIFFALVNQKLTTTQAPYYFAPLSALLLFVASFSHPLLLFGGMFGLIFLALTHDTQRKQIGTLALAYLAFWVIRSLFFKTQHDSDASIGLQGVTQLSVKEILTLTSNKNFLRYLVFDYYSLLVSGILVCLFYVRTRRYAKLILVLGFCLSYTLLINLNYRSGAQQFYVENQYILLSLFVGLPFAYDVFPHLAWRRITIPLVTIMVVLGLFRIMRTHDTYTARLDWERNLMNETAHEAQRKIVVPTNQATQETLKMTWASSYEFWLLSTIEQGSSRSVIIEEGQGEFDWAMGETDAFIAKWGTFKYKDLNPRYFIFKEKGAYVKQRQHPIENSDLDTMIKRIHATPEWIGGIEKSAREKNLNKDSLVLQNAIWMIDELQGKHK